MSGKVARDADTEGIDRMSYYDPPDDSRYDIRCETCRQDPCECCHRCGADPLQPCEPWCGFDVPEGSVPEEAYDDGGV